MKTAEEERFSNIFNRDNSKKEVLKIAKQMKAESCNVVGDKCVKNDKGNFCIEDLVTGPHPQIDKEGLKSALTKMKKGKALGTPGVVMELLLASCDAGLERMTSLFNCILKEKKIPSMWDVSVIVNCFKRKGEAIE